jgi:NADH-quinone oxidoreductase subunit L
LFLGSGSVIHALHGEQDTQNGWFEKKSDDNYFPFNFIISYFRNPSFSGFFSKDEILMVALSTTKYFGSLLH